MDEAEVRFVGGARMLVKGDGCISLDYGNVGFNFKLDDIAKGSEGSAGPQATIEDTVIYLELLTGLRASGADVDGEINSALSFYKKLTGL